MIGWRSPGGFSFFSAVVPRCFSFVFFGVFYFRTFAMLFACRIRRTSCCAGQVRTFYVFFPFFFKPPGELINCCMLSSRTFRRRRLLRIAARPTCMLPFSNKYFNLHRVFAPRVYSRGGAGGLPPQHQSSLHLSAAREARRIQGSCARSAAGEHSLTPPASAASRIFFFNAGEFCYNAREYILPHWGA